MTLYSGKGPPTQAEIDAEVIRLEERFARGEYWEKVGIDEVKPSFEEIRRNFERLCDKPELFMKLLGSQFEQVDAQAKHDAEVQAKIRAADEAGTPEQRAATAAWKADFDFKQWKLRQPKAHLDRLLAEAANTQPEI